MIDEETENYIEHEVRLRLHEVRLRLHDERFKIQEQNFLEIKSELKESINSLRKDMETNFRWTLSIIIGVFLGSVVAKFFG
jgi:hypothetical protein